MGKVALSWQVRLGEERIVMRQEQWELEGKRNEGKAQESVSVKHGKYNLYIEFIQNTNITARRRRNGREAPRYLCRHPPDPEKPKSLACLGADGPGQGTYGERDTSPVFLRAKPPVVVMACRVGAPHAGLPVGGTTVTVTVTLLDSVWY